MKSEFREVEFPNRARQQADIDEQLAPGGWKPENRAKLVDFLTKYSKENPERPKDPAPFAILDADYTTWSGDLDDTTFVSLVRGLHLSARLPEVLPESMHVPAGALGVPGDGRLFAAARLREAMDVMLEVYRRRTSPAADWVDLSASFTEDLVAPGGPLHGEDRFVNAYAVYKGALIGLYQLIDEGVGKVAYDFSRVSVVTPLYAEVIRRFYEWETRQGAGRLAQFVRPGSDGRPDILSPSMHDVGFDQAARRAEGKLGAYTQIVTWMALDKSPEELRRLGADVWYRSGWPEASFEVVVPVDAADASSPAPLDFGADRSHFAAGGRPAKEGFVLGRSAMPYGVRARVEMVDLVGMMLRHGITPAVVSASQVDLVRGALDAAYGFGACPVAGMTNRLRHGVYQAPIEAPVTFRQGKVEAVQEIARRVTGRAEARPALCAGDSNTDLEFVSYSGDYRVFFDRKNELFMGLAAYLGAHGEERATVVERPL